MSAIGERGLATPSGGRGANLQLAGIVAGLPLTLPLLVGLAILCFSFSPRDRHSEDIVTLERLLPKIERAPTLSQEATDAIARLIARQRGAGGASDPSQELRRALVIQRATNALKAKEEATTGRRSSPAI
jgi:hypothetical protein